jgi:serine carboxypeptidase-like clade II
MQVGNALTDDFHDHYGIFRFMWTTGLISFVHSSSQCDKIMDIASTEAGNIDSYSIFTSFASSKNKVMVQLSNFATSMIYYDRNEIRNSKVKVQHAILETKQTPHY